MLPAHTDGMQGCNMAGHSKLLFLQNCAADAGINILAGATLGGGTRINW